MLLVACESSASCFSMFADLNVMAVPHRPTWECKLNSFGMKIVVRDKKTAQYVKETGKYTPLVREAVDFLAKELADDFCARRNLAEHEILTVKEEADRP
jgi:hypothetical protein